MYDSKGKSERAIQLNNQMLLIMETYPPGYFDIIKFKVKVSMLRSKINSVTQSSQFSEFTLLSLKMRKLRNNFEMNMFLEENFDLGPIK